MFNKINVEEYYGPGCKVPPKFSYHSYTSIEIADILKNRKLDDTIFAYLSSFRPSYIRIIPFNKTQHCDSIPWRITIYLNEDETIETIKQEVCLELPDGIINGASFITLLKYGENSKIFKWKNTEYNTIIYASDEDGGTYKIDKNGKKISYPKELKNATI